MRNLIVSLGLILSIAGCAATQAQQKADEAPAPAATVAPMAAPATPAPTVAPIVAPTPTATKKPAAPTPKKK